MDIKLMKLYWRRRRT